MYIIMYASKVAAAVRENYEFFWFSFYPFLQDYVFDM